MAATWATTETAAAPLGDPRRTRRLARLLGDLAARPGTGIPAACAEPAAAKAAYRLLDNAAMEPGAVLAGHVAATVGRLRGEPVVLALQDTTTLDFTGHPGLAGTGPLHRPAQRGLLVHTVLAATPEGVPLGLLDQRAWARDPAAVGARHTRRARETAAKESGRWLAALAATARAVPAGPRVVTVADREADIDDLFAQPRPPGHDLLVRSAHDRRVAGAAGTLRAAAAAAPGGEVVPVPVGRSGEREPREALVVVRWRAVAVQPPRHHRRRARCAPVPATVVTAEEPAPPPGEGPVRWRLLTTLPVADGAAALWCVRAYARRWLVERYHYTLKQGCRVEALQLRTTARLERALAVLAVAAWRLLWLACLARAAPDLPCTVALADDAWPVLWRSAAPGAPLPTRPPPLAEAARLLARLGGFQDRAGDGPPGVVVLWRGLRRLDDLALGWHLATSPPTCG